MYGSSSPGRTLPEHAQDGRGRRRRKSDREGKLLDLEHLVGGLGHVLRVERGRRQQQFAHGPDHRIAVPPDGGDDTIAQLARAVATDVDVNESGELPQVRQHLGPQDPVELPVSRSKSEQAEDRSIGQPRTVLDPPLADTPQGYRMALRRTHEKTRRPGLGRLVRSDVEGQADGLASGLVSGLVTGLDVSGLVTTGGVVSSPGDVLLPDVEQAPIAKRGGEDEQGEQGPHGASSLGVRANGRPRRVP